eukprot:Gb_15399 [translate_table: standard]
MRSWWGKSSSKEVKTPKKKSKDNSIFDALNLRKFKVSLNTSSRGSANGGDDSGSENAYPSPSTSTSVTRSQSFSHGHPLPLPCTPPASILGRSESGINFSQQPSGNKSGRISPFLPLPSPDQVLNRLDPADGSASGSASCASSLGSDDPADRDLSIANGSSIIHAGQSPKQNRKAAQQETRRSNIIVSNNQKLPFSAKRGFSNNREAPKHLQIPVNGALCSVTDSSMSSPSRSPMRTYVSEHSPNGAFWGTKPYPDAGLFGSGNCSSPGSGHNSGQNSMGGDMGVQPFWQHNRGSTERSPAPSPRMRSPGPSSRPQSGAVSPLHPRAGGLGPESPTGRQEEGKHSCHPLPLPPLSSCNSSPYNHCVSAPATSSAGPRSPGGKDNPTSPGSRWKKGKLLGRGTFGHVYAGFNKMQLWDWTQFDLMILSDSESYSIASSFGRGSESGEMCAMKEVTLFSDDPKSKESVRQLAQEIAVLSHLSHPNIVQYYGSETIALKARMLFHLQS